MNSNDKQYNQFNDENEHMMSNQPIKHLNNKIDYSIQMMRGLLTTPTHDKEKMTQEDKGQLNELISNIGLISNNIVRIFDVLRETNFVKIQELIETIHQMFVRQQLCDENMD